MDERADGSVGVMAGQQAWDNSPGRLNGALRTTPKQPELFEIASRHGALNDTLDGLVDLIESFAARLGAPDDETDRERDLSRLAVRDTAESGALSALTEGNQRQSALNHRLNAVVGRLSRVA